jgi:diguanylate cyclase (GGDEF)-like protein/PAS domain S-box-containing protein
MIYANDALARMFGYASAAELMSAAGPILYADPRRRGDLEVLLDTHGEYHDQEVEYQRKDGTRFFGLNSAVTVLGVDGGPAYFDGVISDITERKRADEKVFQLAHYDSLTGLPNRTLLRDRLEQAMRDASRRNTHLALLFLDLDRFKTVNDSLGHDVGDELLKAVAGRLSKEVRESDTVSRQGGDEFILILRDIAGATGAARVAETVLHAVAKPYHIGRHELHITPSIGVALFPDDTDDIEILIRSADAAMYHAKENGRFNFQFFTPEMNARAYERLSLENSLRQALERREFNLHYQPQVDLKSGRISGMEALLRWTSPERGPVPPSVFVPILESSGLIGAVGEWVLQEACRQNRSWQDAGLPALPVSVNLSAFQFRRRNMADVVADVLAESGLSAACLELEFTESAVMQETREISDTIRRLNALGVRLAIDDFGTGYSSLSYLKRFRIQKIKIDQSFIRDIHLDPDDAAITTAIISLARNLKLMVVAEGVETREQYEFLRDHGCDGIQGFYFSTPVPAARFAELVLKERLPA